MAVRRAFVLSGAIVAALLAAGCARREAPPQPSPPVAVAPRPTLAISALDYLSRAASACLFVVRASEVASAREGDSGLGQFARQLTAEHRAIAAQLSFAGRRLNLLPTATLLPAHQAMLDELIRSGDVGATYVRQIEAVLRQALTLHRSFERQSTASPTLKPVAAMAAPIIARELAIVARF